MKPCKLYQFRNKETNLIELVTKYPTVIEKHFKMTLAEINKELEETGLINKKYELSIMFID